ncbi:hypothetical protein [Anoxynatronum buryatiense]|uniref:Dolichyl-diphosphooligosaccharide--protein glycosyltransferase subunit 1 n=1 Tax=Anoxynatronum buryatiense TaxID=489973 RepID=A0AA45WTS8_9CLOT|nr:hypothetical protein [Anoxynatronum buryatiense]SMP44413.1 hypothetical protein SAMN06296020_102180 [Anoxynatronum buryatiense]
MQRLLKILSVCFMMLILLLPVQAHGNAGPVIYNEDPVFSIMADNESKLAVIEEDLVIDLSQEGRFTAHITATYRMQNQQNEELRQGMLFPFTSVHGHASLEDVVIQVDGESIPVEAHHLFNLPMNHYMRGDGSAYEEYVQHLQATTLDEIIEVMKNKGDLPTTSENKTDSGEIHVGAFAYDVDFAPGEVREIQVQYTVRTSQDRSETVKYSSLVAYFLRPASRWQSFEDLTVTVIPHEEQPFLLASSLPLVYDRAAERYSGYFETLPDQDLVFKMYHRQKPESGLLRILSNPYILLLIIPAALVLAVLILVTVVVLMAMKKSKMNLRD